MFKSKIPIFILLLVLYLVPRIINLGLLPVFNDETLYISMAKQLLSDPVNNLFIGFLDGKEPLFFWMLALFISTFSDPVLGARVLSLLTGLVGLIFFYLLGRRLFPPWITVTITLAYIFSPFLLFYQRLGILDSLLVSNLISVLYFLHILFTNKSLKNGARLGITMGLSLLTKSSAALFLLSMAPLAIYWYSQTKNRERTLPYLLVGITIALLLYSVIFFHPLFPTIAQKNATFIYNLPELFDNGAQVFVINLKQSFRWLAGYQGWPLLLISLAATTLLLKKKYQVIPWVIMIVTVIIIESFLAKIYFPRYLLFVPIPLFILLGYFLTARYFLPVALGLIFLPNLVLSFQIVFHPESAALPAIEHWQYVSGWPSGYGVKETADYLSTLHPPIVVTENIAAVSLGIPSFMSSRDTKFETYNFKNSQEQFPNKFLSNNYQNTYFVFTQIQSIPQSWPLLLEKTFARGDNSEKISVYRLK